MCAAPLQAAAEWNAKHRVAAPAVPTTPLSELGDLAEDAPTQYAPADPGICGGADAGGLRRRRRQALETAIDTDDVEVEARAGTGALHGGFLERLWAGFTTSGCSIL